MLPLRVQKACVYSQSLKTAYNQLKKENQDFNMSGRWTGES